MVWTGRMKVADHRPGWLKRYSVKNTCTGVAKMNDVPHRLLWRDQLIATVTNVGWSDFPWVRGKFVAVEMASEIREILEWIERESRTEGGITDDPPFAEELLDEWSIERPDGTRVEITIPVLGFADGTIEWR